MQNDSVKALLLDTEFLLYVFDFSLAREKYWLDRLEKQPEMEADFYRAKHLLQHLDDMECPFTRDEIAELKRRIRTTLRTA